MRCNKVGEISTAENLGPATRCGRLVAGTFSRLAKGHTCARQHDPKLGELAGLSVDFYRPAMLLDDDVVADRKAEPGPFTGRLGRKERVE